MDTSTFDYIIIGAGAAGLHLAMTICDDSFFKDFNILIVDKDSKNINDKTWSFWEKGKGKWDEILDYKWANGKFFTENKNTSFELSPYYYKKIKSLNFYNYAKTKIQESKNITLIKDEIKDVKNSKGVYNLQGRNTNYNAKYVFDSRIDKQFFSEADGYIRILQHFKGRVIKFEADVFDENSFTMMDFRLTYKGTTSFMYILPTSKKEALIEYTFFTKETVEKNIYDQKIEEYIKKYVSPLSYKIKETEQGIIPMTNYPFHRSSKGNHVKIGTAGSWVRPSTGYSFKYSEKYAVKIVENLKSGRNPNAGLFSCKFRIYDTLLLDILLNNNHLGPSIFSQMYFNNPVYKIFKFLDGETSIYEDLKIISTLESKHFLKALFNQFLNKWRK